MIRKGTARPGASWAETPTGCQNVRMKRPIKVPGPVSARSVSSTTVVSSRFVSSTISRLSLAVDSCHVTMCTARGGVARKQPMKLVTFELSTPVGARRRIAALIDDHQDGRITELTIAYTAQLTEETEETHN